MDSSTTHYASFMLGRTLRAASRRVRKADAHAGALTVCRGVAGTSGVAGTRRIWIGKRNVVRCPTCIDSDQYCTGDSKPL